MAGLVATIPPVCQAGLLVALYGSTWLAPHGSCRDDFLLQGGLVIISAKYGTHEAIEEADAEARQRRHREQQDDEQQHRQRHDLEHTEPPHQQPHPPSPTGDFSLLDDNCCTSIYLSFVQVNQ